MRTRTAHLRAPEWHSARPRMVVVGADPYGSLNELTRETGGRWLVTTQGSRHVWDLDAMTYQRLPGEGRGQMDHDEAVHRITRVQAWPAVGSVSVVWFDDPSIPALAHWRQCSTIRSIERLA